jgi:hypothetical protein
MKLANLEQLFLTVPSHTIYMHKTYPDNWFLYACSVDTSGRLCWIIDTKLLADIINNQPNRTESMKDECVSVSVYLCVRGREGWCLSENPNNVQEYKMRACTVKGGWSLRSLSLYFWQIWYACSVGRLYFCVQPYVRWFFACIRSIQDYSIILVLFFQSQRL